MPDIVEVHGAVGEVGDLPAAQFEGRLFWVQGTDAGLYRDNGIDAWDQVSAAGGGGGGLTNPMTAAGSIIVGGPDDPGEPIELVKGAVNSLFGVDEAGNVTYRVVSRGATRLMKAVPSTGWTNIGLTTAFGDGGAHFQAGVAAGDGIACRIRATTGGASRTFVGYFVPT